MILYVLLTVLIQIVCLIYASASSTKCGYESCHPVKDGYVNVHLIPHSHDDVGWVKTVDQFFYGTQSQIYAAGVIYIYDNVLKSVQKNKDRRFIYVESAFFWKWWQLQDAPERAALQNLVNNGQIQFTGGGWSMNDEAATNYQSIIDQMAWGLRKLNESFGDCGRPKMGWQIDPFGHSSEMASIFAQLGFDGVILGRIDYEDKETRVKNKSMEMVWRGSNSLGRKSDIFTSVLFNHYDAPAGFCFDVLCSDEALVDDVNSPEYNIDVKAEDFIFNHVQKAEKSFQTNNIIIPMGRDFAYQQAEGWFQNIDRLIQYVNQKETFNNTKYHLLYSTPSCYAAAVQKESKGILFSPLKTDDFFPYATDAYSFWTGFYTSRPTLKRFERIGNNFLQVCKQLYTITHMSSNQEHQLDVLRDAMGVMQHHDAITGTEKEVVAYDYARMLHLGIEHCENLSAHALSSLTDGKSQNFHSCLLTNISQCQFTENLNQFVITVYNPLSRPVRKYVRLPVTVEEYTVTDPNGEIVKSQIVRISNGVKKIIGRKSKTNLELVFEATNVPPLGFTSYYVKAGSGSQVTPEDVDFYTHFNNIHGTGIDINPSTGLVSQIQMNNVKLNLDQRFWYYNGNNAWTDEFSTKASGAYIFRPSSEVPLEPISETASFEIYRGQIVTEIHQTFNDYLTQVVRIYENELYIEFDWVVGPINIDGSFGKEVITRFSTPLKTNGTFYTDSNGRQLMKRIRNFRPTWNLTVKEAESSNYYPVTSKILIRDEERDVEFAVLTDRAEGGSSLIDGQIELMILRNTISDDQLGVGEALIELAYDRPIVARGSHYIIVGPMTNSTTTVSSIEHEVSTQKLLDSWIFLSEVSEYSFQDYRASHTMQFSGLQRSLPNNIHILTLEPWTQGNYLLRLEHNFEPDLDPILSRSVTIDLEDLFTTFDIEEIHETTLGGNQWLEENERLAFKTTFQSDVLEFDRQSEESDKYIIRLDPMQIRTFIICIKPKL
ncbi:hypothetical protein ABEB36_001615 [Hypothenemus hampei]|uniref:Alpha-mannosidase n=1 Tax=Hypothenemus hampei TaxID=57062 RepID=A0ABD1FF85_HYPHA